MSNDQLLGSSRRQFIDGMPDSSSAKQENGNAFSNQYADYVREKLASGKSEPQIVQSDVKGAGQTSSYDQSVKIVPIKLAQAEASGSAVDYTKSSSLSDAEAKFSQAHKVKITHEQNKFVYSMQYGGTNHRLFETTANQAGLDSASSKLRSLVSDEEKSLTSTYGVTFAKAGEFVAKQKESSDSPDLAHDVVARDPELYELEGIRAALSKSAPSNIAADGKTGVKFYALNEKTILGSWNRLAGDVPE